MTNLTTPGPWRAVGTLDSPAAATGGPDQCTSCGPARKVLVVVALISLTGLLQGANAGVEGLVEQSNLIAAVEIVSIDETAMPVDGPMYVEARILKVIKGNFRASSRIRFGASAWVGPTYRVGEERIVFLAPVPARQTYFGTAMWHSVEAGKIDVFVAPEDLEQCSETLLVAFLKMIETVRSSPPRLEGKLVRHTDSTHRLAIDLVNESDQTLWLRPSKLTTSFDANQMKHSLAIDWNAAGNDAWIPLQAGATLSGNASVDSNKIGEADELTITLGHVAAQFPHRSWAGYRAAKVKIPR